MLSFNHYTASQLRSISFLLRQKIKEIAEIWLATNVFFQLKSVRVTRMTRSQGCDWAVAAPGVTRHEGVEWRGEGSEVISWGGARWLRSCNLLVKEENCKAWTWRTELFQYMFFWMVNHHWWGLKLQLQQFFADFFVIASLALRPQ